MIKIHIVHNNQALTQLTVDTAIVEIGVEAHLKSPLQMIAGFVELSEDANGNPGPWWMEFSGHVVFAIVENINGAFLVQHDPPGAGSGLSAHHMDIRQFNLDHTIDPRRTLENKLGSSVAGQGACWDVFEEGKTSQYATLLVDARALVLLPSSAVQADFDDLTQSQKVQIEEHRMSLVDAGRWRMHDDVVP